MRGTMIIGIVLFVLSEAMNTVSGQRFPAVKNGQEHTRLRRKSQPIVYNIYSLDHFIALVEKIERHPNNRGANLKTVVHYVRKFSDNYDNDLWNIILGAADDLPAAILNSEERRVLKVMMSHSYINGGTQELGVVHTHDSETIAMGNVIAGISAGLTRNRQLSLAMWSPGASKRVDNLFTAALTYDLSLTGLAKKNGDQSERFGPAGTWTTTQCPAKYNKGIQDKTHATDAEILGGIDGFVLGQAVSNWEGRGVRLSQVLRMYYGDGVVYDKTYRSCNRATKFEGLVDEEEISDEIEAFALSYYLKNSGSYPRVTTGDVRQIALDTASAFKTYYGQLLKNAKCSTNENDDEDCELPANIVFVVDESGSIGSYDYLKEKSFVKNIIKAFDVSVLQARVALVEFASYAEVEIGLDDYGAKTPLLCAIDQLQYNSGSTHTASAIAIVNDYILGPAQQAEGASTDTVQMVVLLTDGKSNDRWSLGREVARIKRDIKGLTMIAVGVSNYDLYELQMIATDSEKHVFTVQSFDKLVELVKSLRKEACLAPANLEIDFTQTENETEIVAYVSPGKPRFFTLTADLFFGLKDIYIEITPVYGTVAVYASRVTPNPGPNNYFLNIEPKGVGVPSTLHLTDLCTGYNSSDYCPPLYIGIYGEQSELSCSDLDCQLPNQIKFAIKRGAPVKSLGKKLSGGLTAIFAIVVATLLSFMRNP